MFFFYPKLFFLCINPTHEANKTHEVKICIWCKILIFKNKNMITNLLNSVEGKSFRHASPYCAFPVSAVLVASVAVLVASEER